MVRDKNGKKPYSVIQRKSPNDLDNVQLPKSKGECYGLTERNKYKMKCLLTNIHFLTIKE
jgi:hypothetical protein